MKRGVAEQDLNVWFTNLRKGQTAFGDSINNVSQDVNGTVKISPFFNYSNTKLDACFEQFNLPQEHCYYDSTKMLKNQQCGLKA